MITFTCEKCKNKFESNRRTHNGRKIRFCSHPCAMQGDWNTINKCGDKNVSKRLEVRKKMSEAAKKLIKNARYNWKGNEASYFSIHRWVKTHWGHPKKCEHCGIIPPKHRIEWANVSGKYLREIREDWIQLCTPCHRKFDFEKLSIPKQKILMNRWKNNMKLAQQKRWS